LLALFLASVSISFAFTAAPAGAHGDEGVMTVIAAEQGASASTVRLEIGLVYANDDDLAEEATVTAMLTGPSGETVGPVTLPRITGARYGADAEVPSPGTWTVVITSTAPEAESEPQTVEVSTAAPSSSVAATDDGETSNPIVPVDSGASAAASDAGEDDGTPWAVIVVVALVAVAVAAGAYLALRRKGAVE
jgi:hypothetical protein